MSFFKNISPDTVRKILAPKKEYISALMEVNDVLISDTKESINNGLQDLLARGKIDKQTYDEQLIQNQQELQYRLQARNNLNQQIGRITQLIGHTKNSTQGLVIDSTMTRDDLKQLITLTKARLDRVQKDEKLVLDTILQVLESCKNFLDEKGAFETIVIPIFPSEKKYALRLLIEFKNKPETERANEYLNILSYIENTQKKIHQNKSLSKEEVAILNTFYNNISKEITAELDNLVNQRPFNKENYESRIKQHVDNVEELSKDIKISTGFKGFINLICEKFNIKPVFTISNSSIIKEVEDYKRRMSNNQPPPEPEADTASVRGMTSP